MSESGVGGFDYETRATRVVLRAGAARNVASELERMGTRRPLVVTTPGRAAMARDLAASVGSAAEIWAGARLHVPAAIVEEAAASARRLEADVLVAIGGGSAIGVAKAVALRTDLPILAIPTTYSGSEMTSIWGITEGDEKRTGRDARVAPCVIVYDPLLTLELDPRTSAESGMNAIAHSVEALYAQNANPLTSLLAAESIRMMAGSLRRIVREPQDVEARTTALLAAHFAGCALDMAAMGLHHRICHVLGGMFGLPHALTHAIVLPHVVAFNASAAPAAMATIATGLGESRDRVVAADAAGALRALNVALGISRTLEGLGLGDGDIERAAARVAETGIVHPRPITLDGARRILRGALRGNAPG